MRKLYVLPIMLVIFVVDPQRLRGSGRRPLRRWSRRPWSSRQKVEVVQTQVVEEGCGEVGRGGRDRDAGTAEAR